MVISALRAAIHVDVVPYGRMISQYLAGLATMAKESPCLLRMSNPLSLGILLP
jgi:hypothetical protein